jgi:membrane protease YdiL (CAAX protease family)
MSPGIRDRIGRPAGCDWLLLLLVAVWAVAGSLGNYYRLRGPTDGSTQIWLLLVMALWAAIAGVVVYSMIRRRRRPADYGFSFRGGGVASLAVLVLVHIYLVMSGKFVLSPTGNYLLSTFGASLEELAFRAIAIDRFILLMDGIRAKAFWAILASSVLFTVPHVISKSPAMLQGIFISSLIMGYVYYKSRSILLPVWIHATANAGYLGGILAAGAYCLIGLADLAIWPGLPAPGRAPGASRSAGS